MRSARECLEADANVTTDTEASADVELTTDLHFERGEPDREQVGMVRSSFTYRRYATYILSVCMSMKQVTQMRIRLAR